MKIGCKILPDPYGRPEQNEAEFMWHAMVRFNKRFVLAKAYGASDKRAVLALVGGEMP